MKNQLETIAINRFSKNFADLTKQEQYTCLANLVNNLASEKIKETNEIIASQKTKEVYYFSMEFLMGRLLLNNIENMGVFNQLQEVLDEYNISIKDLEIEELDAGLGNGGLGRLAACFMDSIASLNYAGHGVTIRYRNGFFKQAFDNNNQIELPDLWLTNRNEWENQIIDDATLVKFYGNTKHDDNGVVLENTIDVLAMPYDMPIVGKEFKTCNRLRMYDILPVETGYKHDGYENMVSEIASSLYPDDSDVKGKELRVKQQYVFVSAGIQNIIKNHLKKYNDLNSLADYVVMQINDTHPTLLIPEMIRILMDQYQYSFDDALSLTSKSIAYTNHTILAEALEKWDVELIKNLLPRVFEIIEMLDAKLKSDLEAKNYDNNKILEMAIIGDNQVRMAHIAIAYSFSVNGVAALHTEILKEKTLADWHQLYPNKLNNKTNGITQRRWFEYSNPKLVSFLRENATNKDESDAIAWFKQFLANEDQKEFLDTIESIKLENKKELVRFIQEKEGFTINENSIFDIQIKRLHAYKRQLLNVLHIIYLYQKLDSDQEFFDNFYPQTFIFGAKAAPSYVFAKNVIKLINKLHTIIAANKKVSEKLTVLIVENYNVSYAEKLIPAADISEQISTAGYEASGTGNMKFMMNGALTLGTLDGANVEIHQLVGDDNIEIFGLSKDEVNKLHLEKTYNAKTVVENNPEIKAIFDFIDSINENDEFAPIFHDLFNDNDYYLVLEDFEAYKKAQANMNAMYKDRMVWNKKAVVNIANSGFFSSDRTIQDYVNDIWHLEKIK